MQLTKEDMAVVRLMFLERLEQLAEGATPHCITRGICNDMQKTFNEMFPHPDANQYRYHEVMDMYPVCYAIYGKLGYEDTSGPLGPEPDPRNRWGGERGDRRRRLANEMRMFLMANPLPEPEGLF